jgi:plasmid stabilization system protein ParE
MRIRWTTTAKQSYFNVLDYLKDTWSERESISFIEEVDNLLDQIARYPKMFPESSKKSHVRKAFITKHNTLYYQYNQLKKELVLLTFWDNRQDPEKMIY